MAVRRSCCCATTRAFRSGPSLDAAGNRGPPRPRGLHETAAGTEVGLAITELSAGQPDAALAALLRSDAILSELGERSYRSTTQAMLARTREPRGDREAANGAIDLGEELGRPDDLLNK